MEAFKTVIWIINIFAALAVVVLVLMQHGKGADAGATFGSGSGSAQGVFGSGGNANFLSRSTAIAATVFFVTCIAMGYIHTHSTKHGLDFSNVQQSSPAKNQGAPAGNPNQTPTAPQK
ncbi:protein-export integral membrane protein [Neisseria animaloris]|uniref:Protein-export membrane protein SecG n=1 Tax=Neisseria animaloris TaxID=326522 RepID=A0A1X3CM33_9NEIS|nr:preprotein translocase subunit SecG [Neisseria animaloris]OSI08666.1 preprotein translocase subunit SecG [Neisseria animaloris]VEH87387.1 protein-export integral membrane protein [Neisseria animaloris]VEJ20459.1 protein-export integral membrane protein [Neisseria animaloris]